MSGTEEPGAKNRLSVMQVSTADVAGGAERVAVDLHLGTLRRGVDSTLSVGFKFADYPNTELIPNDAHRGLWARAWNAVAPKVPAPPGRLSDSQRRIRQMCKAIGEPSRALRIAQGFEDHDFPATRLIPGLSPTPPAVMHLHNLHGGYFDIRALPDVCRSQPTVMTLHDTWIASGHCAHFVLCQDWLTGCGSCEHLNYPPRLRQDKTHENWLLKKSVLENPDVKLHFVGPSKWVLDVIERSAAAPAIASTRVIPNGVDQSVFTPGDKSAARRSMGISDDALVLSFAMASRTSPYKDPATLENALPKIAKAMYQECAMTNTEVAPLVFLGIGGVPIPATIEGVQVVAMPFSPNPADVARCLVASDVFVHAAVAEVLPLALLEAQSCGLPVIVTRTGGAPDALIEGETGLIVRQSDPDDLVGAAVRLLLDREMRERMSQAALANARKHFGLDLMIDAYLSLYHELAENQPGATRTTTDAKTFLK